MDTCTCGHPRDQHDHGTGHCTAMGPHPDRRRRPAGPVWLDTCGAYRPAIPRPRVPVPA